MTAACPVDRDAQHTIEQLIFDYPDLPVTVVVRTATAAVRSVRMFGDLDGDHRGVAYLTARQELDFMTRDIREVLRPGPRGGNLPPAIVRSRCQRITAIQPQGCG